MIAVVAAAIIVGAVVVSKRRSMSIADDRRASAVSRPQLDGPPIGRPSARAGGRRRSARSAVASGASHRLGPCTDACSSTWRRLLGPPARRRPRPHGRAPACVPRWLGHRLAALSGTGRSDRRRRRGEPPTRLVGRSDRVCGWLLRLTARRWPRAAFGDDAGPAGRQATLADSSGIGGGQRRRRRRAREPSAAPAAGGDAGRRPDHGDALTSGPRRPRPRPSSTSDDPDVAGPSSPRAPTPTSAARAINAPDAPPTSARRRPGSSTAAANGGELPAAACVGHDPPADGAPDAAASNTCSTVRRCRWSAAVARSRADAPARRAERPRRPAVRPGPDRAVRRGRHGPAVRGAGRRRRAPVRVAALRRGRQRRRAGRHRERGERRPTALRRDRVGRARRAPGRSGRRGRRPLGPSGEPAAVGFLAGRAVRGG